MSEPYLCGDTGMTALLVLAGVDLPLEGCPFCEAAGGAPDCSDCGVATIAASAASFS